MQGKYDKPPVHELSGIVLPVGGPTLLVQAKLAAHFRAKACHRFSQIFAMSLGRGAKC